MVTVQLCLLPFNKWLWAGASGHGVPRGPRLNPGLSVWAVAWVPLVQEGRTRPSSRHESGKMPSHMEIFLKSFGALAGGRSG